MIRKVNLYKIAFTTTKGNQFTCYVAAYTTQAALTLLFADCSLIGDIVSTELIAGEMIDFQQESDNSLKLKDALQFYANESNWITHEDEDSPFDEFIPHDKGQRAREALGK